MGLIFYIKMTTDPSLLQHLSRNIIKRRSAIQTCNYDVKIVTRIDNWFKIRWELFSKLN